MAASSQSRQWKNACFCRFLWLGGESWEKSRILQKNASQRCKRLIDWEKFAGMFPANTTLTDREDLYPLTIEFAQDMRPALFSRNR
jgi:hypothetical protein